MSVVIVPPESKLDVFGSIVTLKSQLRRSVKATNNVIEIVDES